MSNYTVYKHTVPNGKVYIGITTQNPEKRWNKGNGYRYNKSFFSDIIKYGWYNIKHEILFENLSRTKAEKIEKELIEKYNSYHPYFGYNSDTGGLGCHVSGHSRPDYVKDKIRKSMSKKAKSVVQYDRYGNKICEYESMREAERQTGVRAGNISRCCVDNYLCEVNHTAGGYIWKYPTTNHKS